MISGEPGAFGVYVHIPFCAHRCDYCDFATWTDRGASHRRLRRRVRHRHRTRTRGRASGSRRACSSAAGRRRCSSRPSSRGSSTRSTAPTTPRSPSSAIPTASTRAKLARLPRGRREPALASVCSRCRRTCSQRSVARTTPTTSRVPSRSPATPGSRTSTSTSSTARPARRSTTGAVRWPVRSTLGVEHVSAYALTVEPANAARPSGRRRRTAAPDDDDQADEVRAGRRAARRPRASSGTRSPTGLGRARSAGTTCCYWSRASTSASAAPRTATPTAAAGGTCARPSATSTASPPARPTEADGERLDPAARREEAFVLGLRTAAGARPLRGAEAAAADLVAAGFVRSARRARRADAPRPPARVRCDGATPRRGGRPGRWHSVASSANEHPRRVREGT